MMRRLIALLVGLSIGFLFSNIPVLCESLFGVILCRESCPGLFTGVFICTYLLIPLAWAALLVNIANKPKTGAVRSKIVVAIAASGAIMAGITFYAHGHQVRWWQRAMANWSLHADANMGHGFAILLPHVGALRPLGSGAGELGR